jgi:hypothetical protein
VISSEVKHGQVVVFVPNTSGNAVTLSHTVILAEFGTNVKLEALVGPAWETHPSLLEGQERKGWGETSFMVS